MNTGVIKNNKLIIHSQTARLCVAGFVRIFTGQETDARKQFVKPKKNLELFWTYNIPLRLLCWPDDVLQNADDMGCWFAWWLHIMKGRCALRSLCAGNPPNREFCVMPLVTFLFLSSTILFLWTNSRLSGESIYIYIHSYRISAEKHHLTH